MVSARSNGASPAITTTVPFSGRTFSALATVSPVPRVSSPSEHHVRPTKCGAYRVLLVIDHQTGRSPARSADAANVGNHRLAEQRVQDLRQRRFHAGSASRREDDSKISLHGGLRASAVTPDCRAGVRPISQLGIFQLLLARRAPCQRRSLSFCPAAVSTTAANSRGRDHPGRALRRRCLGDLRCTQQGPDARHQSCIRRGDV